MVQYLQTIGEIYLIKKIISGATLRLKLTAVYNRPYSKSTNGLSYFQNNFKISSVTGDPKETNFFLSFNNSKFWLPKMSWQNLWVNQTNQTLWLRISS